MDLVVRFAVLDIAPVERVKEAGHEAALLTGAKVPAPATRPHYAITERDHVRAVSGLAVAREMNVAAHGLLVIQKSRG